jgi:hypothetical protein
VAVSLRAEPGGSLLIENTVVLLGGRFYRISSSSAGQHSVEVGPLCFSLEPTQYMKRRFWAASTQNSL